MAEHLTLNQPVEGSTPSQSTTPPVFDVIRHAAAFPTPLVY